MFNLPKCVEGKLEWVEVSNIHNLPTPTTDMYIYNLVSNNEFFVLDAIYDDNVELVSLEEKIKQIKII
jgi:8-oxo-dGTP diphosphatase